MSGKRALVVGLGIGGMSAAIGLRKAGWTPVIVERAPERRTGGYFIGLFPEGKEAAKRLGVFDKIHTRTPEVSETWEADEQRTRIAGFLDQPGHPEAVLRGDIEQGLWDDIEGDVEVRFGLSPARLHDTGDGVDVTLRSADGTTTTERFDLVIGADGLRSTTRRLAFGPDGKFMKSQHSIICAYQLDQQVPGYDEHAGLVDSQVGRSLWLFAFNDRPPTALFTYRTRDVAAQFTGSHVDTIRKVYAGMNQPAVEHALRGLESADEALFDSVHMVKMRRWHKGRVMLLGDAAWCVTLYSGYGATSAMLGGAELADALTAHPEDLEAALTAWEGTMRPFIRTHRFQAHLKHEVFVPSNRLWKTVTAALMRRGGERVAQAAARAAVPA